MILLTWEPHFLRLHLRGELQSTRLLDLCRRHLDLAPFNRLVLDVTRLEDHEPGSLGRLADGLLELLAAGGDTFLLVADDGQARELSDVVRAVAAWGTGERQLERWVRTRHATRVAAVNQQSIRWSLPSFGRAWLAGEAAV